MFTDFWWKLLSLAIAVLLWIFVTSEPRLSTFVSVPVEYKNLAPELDINSSLIESVYLELRGPAGELRSEGRQYRVVLDMSGVGPGERTFSIGPGDVRLPQGVRMVRSVPSQIRFDFERREVRQVPVHVRFAGPPGASEAVQRATVSPPVLRIEGPASRVDQVRAVVTDPIDLTGVSGTHVFRVNTYVGDQRVRFVQNQSEVSVTVEMKRR